jgi:hypothetical protein
MQGQSRLTCRDCGRTATVSGEMPAEYSNCFVTVVQRDGWVIAPGTRTDLLCGDCLKGYMGSETRDDEEKVNADREPREL